MGLPPPSNAAGIGPYSFRDLRRTEPALEEFDGSASPALQFR
jgi:hypothetical protein